ncbi:hypothetical protein [Nevskia sp.]|nr:hypothetical protein [Nevskia sp.]
MYVVNWESNTVQQIDAAALRVTRSVETADGPRGFGRFIAPSENP